jgi:transcriptional regulator with XRE-family HTH domain
MTTEKGQRRRAKRSDPLNAGSIELATGRPTSADRQVGRCIRLRRIACGMTAQQLSEQVGVSAPQIGKYEQGIDRVAASHLYLIAAALRAPIDRFFEGVACGSEQGTSVQSSWEAEIIRLFSDDSQSQTEAARLVGDYSRIGSARKRRAVLHLVRLLASEPG